MAPASRFLVVVWCAFALSGCGARGPSQGDVESALRARFAISSPDTHLVAATLKGCKAADERDKFDCSVEIHLQMKDEGGLWGVSNVRMEKSGSTWSTPGGLNFEYKRE